MTNWCVGTLKIRGKKENIINFIFNGLDVLKSSSKMDKIQADDDGHIHFTGYAWIKGTYQGYVKYMDVCLDNLAGDDNEIVLLETEFTFYIDVYGLAKISAQYNLDFKILGFNKTKEKNHNVEIIKGKIIKDNVISFYSYKWECDCPNLGGNNG